MKLALDERVILYFDILGYKQKFEEENFNSIEYLQTIRSVMSRVQEYAKTVGSIVLKIFSDNACMVFDTGDKGTGLSLAKIIAYELQQVLLEKYSVLIRGCISYGEIYIDDDLVYGAGLIKCVEMEEQAEYPRIIIDSCLNSEIFSDAYGVLAKITDDYYEVTYLDGVVAGDESYDMLSVRNRIIEMTNKYCTKDLKQKAKVIKKYKWLVDTFNKLSFDLYIRVEKSTEQQLKVS